MAIGGFQGFKIVQRSDGSTVSSSCGCPEGMYSCNISNNQLPDPIFGGTENFALLLFSLDGPSGTETKKER